MKVNIGTYMDGNNDRPIDVVIEKQDTWSLDHTLALIIHPALVQFRKEINGAPKVDMDDVPESLRDDCDPEDPWDEDSHWFERWEWVVDEMIWAFNELANVDDIDREYNPVINARIDYGLYLFGKYFRGLWT